MNKYSGANTKFHNKNYRKKVTIIEHAEKVQFDIANSDGNAFALIGGWKRAARREGWSEDEIETVIADAMSGDYDHLVQTIMEYSE